MPAQNQHTITRDLNRWNDGDSEAAARVLSQIYADLRAIAATYQRHERPGHTLEATAVVHEAYLRLFGREQIRWQSRSHFLGLAARVMRRVLVDYAREHGARKRGGDRQRVAVIDLGGLTSTRAPDLLALDDALHDLTARDSRQAQIVEARFFGGLNVEQTAAYVGVSRATVIRQWRLAKAWLYGELNRETGHGG